MAQKQEDLTGQVDGVAILFFTTAPYSPGSLRVWLASGLQRRGLDGFFTETTPAAGTFTTNEPPDVGDELQVDYEVAGSGDVVLFPDVVGYPIDPFS